MKGQRRAVIGDRPIISSAVACMFPKLVARYIYTIRRRASLRSVSGSSAPHVLSDRIVTVTTVGATIQKQQNILF